MTMKSLAVLASLALLLASCGEKDEPQESEVPDDSTSTGTDADSASKADADGDGYRAEDGDCDDNNAAVYPGRLEDCNGVDDNCNNLTDEGFADTDGDTTADCMDSEESPDDCDGLDNDGDGQVDETFADSDGDGVADCVGTEACDGKDNDGDGQIDEGYDFDGDGVTQCADDCDDSDATSYPGAEEVDGDGRDNDCDGLVDDGSYTENMLYITEIMVNPAKVGDPDGEWFELHNPSETDTVYINGFKINSDSGESHQITSDETLAIGPGEYFVLGLNDNTVTNGGVTVDYLYSGVSFSNESDSLSVTADGVTLFEVAWDDGATMPDPDGASIMVDPEFLGTDHSYPNAWCAATEPWNGTKSDDGSPGLANELCSTTDHDLDGFSKDQGDCDDTDADIYPNAPEKDPTKDNDCDGEVESMPFALADYNAAKSTLKHCDLLYLVGSGSYDPEGTSLTYSWELVSAPSTSATTTADIDTTTSQNPTFTPDEPGTYVFSLTVNDGGTDSLPSTLSVTVGTQTSNSTPFANAGSDQSASDSSTCQPWSYGAYYTCDNCDDYDFTLDGTGSTDSNGTDHMTYAWTVVSGSSYATLSDPTSSAPTVTVSGVTATQGSTNSQDITVSLTVTDCYGATSAADIVTVTYECTGI